MNVPKVHYDNARAEFQDGDVLLFRGQATLSRIIQSVTGSEYSHSGLVGLWSGTVMVLEAKPAGVVASRLSQVVKRYEGRVEWFGVAKGHEPDRSAVVAAAREELGKAYGWGTLFWILGHRLAGTRPKPGGEYPTTTLQCAEFVSRAWRHGGVDLAESRDRLTTPADLAASPSLERRGLLTYSADDKNQLTMSASSGGSS